MCLAILNDDWEQRVTWVTFRKQSHILGYNMFCVSNFETVDTVQCQAVKGYVQEPQQEYLTFDSLTEFSFPLL